MTHTSYDSEEESFSLPLDNNTQPRRFARNPRREGYERDTGYVGATDSDLVRSAIARRFEQVFEAEVDRCSDQPPSAEDIERQGKLMSLSLAADHLLWAEQQVSEEDLARPEIAQLMTALNAFQCATWRLVWKG